MVVAVAQSSPTTEPSLLIHSGESIAFLGDSITANGWNMPGGYVRLVVDGLEQCGEKVTPIPAGVSGNTSGDMLARLEKDVLSKSPTWLTISCGVNDVWHGATGVDLDAYKSNIRTIVERAEARHIKVMLLTATVIGEEPNQNNTRLAAYNDFLRALAKEKSLPLADLNAACHATLDPLQPTKDSRILTVDGVHMNAEGNVVMARGILTAFAIAAAKVDQIESAWLTRKDTASLVVYPYDPRPNLGITLGQFRAMAELAKRNNSNAVEMGRTLWLRAMAEAVAAQGDTTVLNADKVKSDAQSILEKRLQSIELAEPTLFK